MYRVMSETEVAISRVQNLRMLNFYELTGVNKEGKQSDLHTTETGGAMALAVYFGEKDQLNLSELDPYYSELVARVFTLYNECDQKSAILMDENTRRIMESGTAPVGTDPWAAFYEKTPEEGPVIPESASLSRQLIPVTEYLLTGLYRVTGRELKVTRREYGWRGAGMLLGSVDDDPQEWYLRAVKMGPDRYTVSVGRFLLPQANLTIRMTVAEDCISLTYRAEGLDFHGEAVFSREDGTLRDREAVYYNGKLIFYQDDKLPITEVPAAEELLKLMPENSKDITGFLLPWGTGWYRRQERKCSGALEISRETDIFWYPKAALCELRDRTRVTNTENDVRITVRAGHVIREMTAKHRIQTHFVKRDGNVGGKYRELLEDHYFMD